MNSQQEDSKDTNAEGSDSYSFNVLGKKRYLTSYNPKIKARKIRADCYPASRGFVSLFFSSKSFVWLASSLWLFSRHTNDFVNVMA